MLMPSHSIGRFSLSVALGLALGSAALPVMAMAQSAPQSANVSLADAPLVYRVLPGDTLIDVARKYLRHPLDYRHLQRDNNIANPRQIPIGRMIRINTALLRTRMDPASLESYRGEIRIRRNGQNLTLATGMPLQEGDVIVTAANSFARIAFSDGSHTVVPSNSQIKLDRLRRFVINNEPDHRLVVERGRSESQVSTRRQPGGFRVSTPVSVSAVRGTEFRVAYDENLQTSATSVLEGAVATANTSADASGVLIREGFGASTRSSSNTVLEAALLPPPTLEPRSIIQDQAEMVFAVAAPAGTVKVRGLIGDDAGLVNPVAEIEADTAQPLNLADELPEGQWFIRLTATSADLLEGKARTYSFIRARNGIEDMEQSSTSNGTSRIYNFGWKPVGEGEASFRFQLARADENDAPVGPPLVDTPGLSAARFTLTDLPAGNYVWRVEGTRYRFGHRLSAWSKPELLTISR